MDDTTLLQNTRFFLAAVQSATAESLGMTSARQVASPLSVEAFTKAVVKLSGSNKLAAQFAVFPSSAGPQCYDFTRGLSVAKMAGLVSTTADKMIINMSGLQVNRLANDNRFEDAMDLAKEYRELTGSVERTPNAVTTPKIRTAVIVLQSNTSQVLMGQGNDGTWGFPTGISSTEKCLADSVKLLSTLGLHTGVRRMGLYSLDKDGVTLYHLTKVTVPAEDRDDRWAWFSQYEIPQPLSASAAQVIHNLCGIDIWRS